MTADGRGPYHGPMPTSAAGFARRVARDPDMIAYYTELLDGDDKRAPNAVAFTAREVLERCEQYPGNWRQMRQYSQAVNVFVRAAAKSTDPRQSRWCSDMAEGLQWQAQVRWRRRPRGWFATLIG
jgi:hypothetical protein